MDIENISEEFLSWLDKCPVLWVIQERDKRNVTYRFMEVFDEEEE